MSTPLRPWPSWVAPCLVSISRRCRPLSLPQPISATSTKAHSTSTPMGSALVLPPMSKVRPENPPGSLSSHVFTGGITASMPAGSWLGSLVSGYLSDILGRKKSIQIGSIIWCIGSILVCASQNIAMLIVGRIINGLAVGICSAQVPVYVSLSTNPIVDLKVRLIGRERSPRSRNHPSVEDLLVPSNVSNCDQVRRDKSDFRLGAITWGILIMFYISYGCSFIDGTAAFRVPWGLQMLPAIFLLFAMQLLPESPRWLAKKDRWEEAVNVLALGMSRCSFLTGVI
jgi:hypothetical protein